MKVWQTIKRPPWPLRIIYFVLALYLVFGLIAALVWFEFGADASLTRPSPSRAVISMAGVETEITLCEGPMPVVKGRQRGLRWRMICPHCASVRDALHFVDGAWCCRGSACGNLSYACRHQMRYCPSVARRVRLRRALIRTRPGSLRAWMLREQIRREGKAMVAHLERVHSALDKRSKRHARHGRRTSPERT